MKKCLLISIVLFILCRMTTLGFAQNLDGGTGSGDTTKKGQIIQIGDSLTEGMAEYGGLMDKYKAAGWTPIVPGNPSAHIDGDFCSGATNGYPCHSLSGGNSPTGLEAIDQNSSAIQSASVIVMEMGTNTADTDFASAVNQAVTKIHQLNPTIKIYWVNIAAKPQDKIAEFSARNKILADAAAAEKITIIDWFHKLFPTGNPINITDTLSEPNGWLQTQDHVHLTIPAGYNAMADFVVSSVTSDAGSSNTGGLISNTNGIYTSSCVAVKVGNPISPPPTCAPIQGTTTNTVTPSNFIYYCQGSSDWGNTCNLGQQGCGPTSLAMVFSTLGVPSTPAQMANTFGDNGFFQDGCGGTDGSYMTQVLTQWVPTQGFTTGPDLTSGGKLNLQQAKTHLDAGYLIVGSSNSYPCIFGNNNCRSGQTVNHIFVIDGVSVDNHTISIRDPLNCTYAASGNKEVQALSAISIDSSPGNFPWLYAYPIKKN